MSGFEEINKSKSECGILREKNILHIANYCAIYRGNFIESLDNLSRQVKKCGGESIYMFPQDAENIDWVKDLQNNGRKVYFFANNVLKDKKKIKRIIKENKIAIIHMHFLTSKQILSVQLANIGKKVKGVIHFHNHPQQLSGMKNLVRRMFYRRFVIIGVSQSVANVSKKCYPKNKIFSIPNALAFERLDIKHHIDRAEYGLKQNSVVCLIFGFDFYRKGVDLALRALSELNNTGVRYELLISLSKNFDAVQEETRKILGSLPEWVHIIKARNDVSSLYELSDIFLTPSREEGFCYSAVEAAYNSCVVVLSKIPAQEDLVLPSAYFFIDGDIADFKNQIENAENGIKDKLLAMEEDKKFIRARYDLTQWSNEVISVYESIL